MLGYLQGRIISKNNDTLQCIVLVQEVGYELTVPRRLLDSLHVDQSACFWIHTHVREDQLSLFGFGSEIEKQFFRILLSVSGLGPKTALSLLGEHGAERLTQLVLRKQMDEISEAPGVGKKLAQRLVLELASKLEKWSWVETLQKHPSAPKPSEALSTLQQLREDLSSALLHLGYQPSPVKNTLDKLFEREGVEAIGFESCLRTALKEMSVRG